MTKILIDRSTLASAQEALAELIPDERDTNCDGHDARDVRWWRAVEKALRAALAEPVQGPEPPPDAQTEAEKVAYCAGWWAALEKARKEQPEQEPVYLEVCCDAHPKWMRVNQRQFDEYVAHGWEGRRLYTAPPQRKPLTDEQKQAIHNETGAGHSLICLVESYINGIKE